MAMKKNKTEKQDGRKSYTKKPKYEKPEVITYTNDDVIKNLGPAQACSVSPCTVTP